MKNIIDNWDNYWKDYARLNPDLALNNIITKRALLNHYKTHGHKENRTVSELITEDEPDIIIKSITSQYVLNENIFKEKL